MPLSPFGRCHDKGAGKQVHDKHAFTLLRIAFTVMPTIRENNSSACFITSRSNCVSLMVLSIRVRRWLPCFATALKTWFSLGQMLFHLVLQTSCCPMLQGFGNRQLCVNTAYAIHSTALLLEGISTLSMLVSSFAALPPQRSHSLYAGSTPFLPCFYNQIW